MRNRSGSERHRRIGRAAGAALALALLFGCGAQDLYQPPTAPYHVVGRFALPSDVEDVAVLGDVAYLACGQAGLIIVDISDPANPTLIKALDTVKYAESVRVASTPSVNGVTDIAFVVEGTEGITTYDVTDPANAYSYEQGTTAVDGNGMFVELRDDPDEPYIVYLAESWKGVRIFESTSSLPGYLQYNGVFADTRGYARGIAVQDGFAYVADDEMGLAVLDVRTLVLGQVAVISSCDTDGNARGVVVHGDYAFVADYEDGLVVLELRDEQPEGAAGPIPVPYIVAHLPLGGRCQTIVFRDDKLFIAAQDGGVHFVDVSVPASPVYLGTVITSDATGVALANSGAIAVSDRNDGLLVLTGGGAFTDDIPPAAVTDLAGVGVDSSTVRLSWHAPGNDRLSGTASMYDVRYSLDSITTATAYDAATPAEGEPAPSVRGTAETFDVTGLESGTKYYFALETADASQNRSGLSNVASAITPSGNVPPTLAGGSVRPEAGTEDSTYVFEVTYQDGDGDAPVQANVLIDGEPHAMTLASGDYENGAVYRYSSTLGAGGHQHAFSFKDPKNQAVTTATVSAPAVGKIVFVMGSPAGEVGRDTDEDRHTVVLTHEIWVADHEVTQAQYDSVMHDSPSRFVGDDRPVEKVSWLEAATYCNALSTARGYTPAYAISGSSVTWNRDADGFRLPTEAEWEAYCRAGTATAFPGGTLTAEACDIDPILDAAGWYCGNAGASTHDVATKAANPWGLHDMQGNVWEWCWDWYNEHLGTAVAVDPSGPGGGSQKSIRGGSWYYFARECRSASRAPYWPGSKDDVVGFRVVRTLFE